MSANTDPLGSALGLPVMQSGNTVKGLVAKSHDDSAKNDFEMARANIHEVIQNGLDAMGKLSQIADQSQHPRSFEVLAKLMDTLLQANKDLLELQKNIRQISAADTPTNENAQSVTNNLFVGSTAELGKAIENLNKK